MSWSDARALAVAAGGKLASPENQAELDLLVSQFRPTNNQEVQYWIGGRQGVWSMPYPWWWHPHCLESGEEPWTCWSWADYQYSNPWWPLLWEPEDNCGVTPTWCTWCGSGCTGCPEGGWLPGQPDDGDPVDPGDPPACDEDREENLMTLVLNAGGDPDLNGFADVDSNGLYHGLIVRDTDEGTTYQYQRLWAYEFRYDGGRERYLARRLNPANPDPLAQDGILDSTWTDYDLDGSAYGDYQVAVGGSVTELQRYVPGLAQQVVATGAAEYFLGDQIGTTRFLTDDDQSPPVAATNHRVYTAFGELVEMTGNGETRYGYAGAWGYQEHDADLSDSPDNILGSPPTGPAIGEVFPFLHVGARYYDPSTGRFLQRDPIGILGGTNVYDYVQGRPVDNVDPSGLLSPSVGTGFEGGMTILEGAEVVAAGAAAARDDLLRRHIIEAHPELGESAGCYVKGCPKCRRLVFAARRRAARQRNKKIYPQFFPWPWNWGLSGWNE
ncbi:MAG: hypothetical protein JXB13_00605 [Phycisphaerae bacterium]|nr:hypothetical protein [Phycisphaerae bacterium]